MRILLLQHEDVEHAGSFRPLFKASGHDTVTVRLNHHDPIPSLEGFDALWVLGGPMNTWQEAEYPWLVDEKALIKEAVIEREMPFFGLCLGHQLLADALDGEAGPAAIPEIGVLDVQVTEAGAKGLFKHSPAVFKAVQWHGAEVKKMPTGAVCLATSPDCPVEAMSLGQHAHSVQFHVEIEHDTVKKWGAIPVHAKDLSDALGDDGMQIMEQACQKNLADLEATAERVYQNWLTAIGR